MRNFLFFTVGLIIFSFSFFSCKTSSLSVQVLKPAEITVPFDIKTIAVVNRSLPGEGSHVNNIIEGIVTGEGLFVDREASGNTVAGVADALVSSPRFKVTVPTGIDLRGTGTAKWPEPLEWSVVKEICQKYSADALITLETFDSNVGRSFSVVEKTKTVEGATVKYLEHLAKLDISIEAGWRIYYPTSNKILDQNVFVDHKFFDSAGLSKEEAEKKLPVSRYAIKDAGHFAGEMYAYRISPMWVWVSRSYYKKGNDDLKFAKFDVKASQWDKAKEKWLKYINDPDYKIAGYACYNMALASEIEGDLPKALEWAKKSYTDYRLKPALGYMRTIEQRMRDQEKLKEQMEK
ncbi:MAG: DUF6340 family protein [Bacteroidota bacterium]